MDIIRKRRAEGSNRRQAAKSQLPSPQRSQLERTERLYETRQQLVPKKPYAQRFRYWGSNQRNPVGGVVRSLGVKALAAGVAVEIDS